MSTITLKVLEMVKGLPLPEQEAIRAELNGGHESESFGSRSKKPRNWPPGFFDEIHITDPAFERPPQGTLPPIKPL